MPMTKDEANELLKNAVEAGNVEQVKRALENGADPNGHQYLITLATDERSRVVSRRLHGSEYEAAKSANCVEITRLLLEAGADANEQDGYGYTALMWCNNAAQMRLLLDARADVNMVNNYGYTALMLARDKETIRLLIEAGADINARNNNGRSAYDFINSWHGEGFAIEMSILADDLVAASMRSDAHNAKASLRVAQAMSAYSENDDNAETETQNNANDYERSPNTIMQNNRNRDENFVH